MNDFAKPRVAVFGLGGTIAMTQAPGGGVSPALSAPELLAAVPGLDGLAAELRTVDFRRKPGASVSFGDLFELSAAIRAALDNGGTGAMRNPTMAGADGPANILAAIQVALSPAARGLGCLVVLGDQIHAARWVRKTHTASAAAFASPGHGPLGEVVEGRVHLPVA